MHLHCNLVPFVLKSLLLGQHVSFKMEQIISIRVAPPGNINWVGFTMQPVIGIEFVADTTRGSGPACEPLCICHPDARPPCLAESLSAPCRSRLPTTSQIQTGTRHASPPVAEGRRPEAAATKSRDRGGAVASPLSHLLVSAAGATRRL
jgi:hypothetical protein